jgi:membrane protein YdbS with pleckstrin-like domain
MHADDHVFRSKVDVWLKFVVAGGLVAMWLTPVSRVWAGRPTYALDVVIPLLSTAFIVWVFRTTRYEISAETLIVRAGPIRRTVPLRSVRRLRATHNPLSSPALSLDRIEVTYGSRRVLISPEDKRGFVLAILMRAPAVVVDGLPTA